MRNLIVAGAFALAAICSFNIEAEAMPAMGSLTQATAQAEAASPIIQVDRRCGRGRHYVARHRYHGHWVKAACVRNR